MTRFDQVKYNPFKHIPMHIQEGVATKWEPYFAWLPVKTEQGTWVWLRKTNRRWFYPPAWFSPPAPTCWAEYSDYCQGKWDYYET